MIPNAFIDEKLRLLSDKALRVYMMLIRHKKATHSVLIKSQLKTLDQRSVLSALKELIDMGLARKILITDKEAFDLLCRNSADTGCLFCGWNNAALDSHHYPVRAKDGGIETIDICPNCHREFHCLVDYGYYEVIE
jgi:hypothetical protein